jgi:phosphoribosyl 1,2-cyclic phosphate phosphodiesterase
LHKKYVEIYANNETAGAIKKAFSYIFDENTYKGGGIPLVTMHMIDVKPFDVFALNVTPILYKHGPTTVFGFRIGDLAYMTDCSFIPESEYPKLKGLKVLILGALRYRKHETHFSFDEAIDAAERIGAERTYFTHMTHDIVHDEAEAKLPKGIKLAYDGLKIKI